MHTPLIYCSANRPPQSLAAENNNLLLCFTALGINRQRWTLLSWGQLSQESSESFLETQVTCSWAGISTRAGDPGAFLFLLSMGPVYISDFCFIQHDNLKSKHSKRFKQRLQDLGISVGSHAAPVSPYSLRQRCHRPAQIQGSRYREGRNWW